MNHVRINRDKFSRIVWENIFESTALDLHEDELTLRSLALAHEQFRTEADYNTGTVSFDAMRVLYSVASFFKPKRIAEVGTFIGNSTNALSRGAPDAEIHTCDMSNDINIFPEDGAIMQYKKKSSTEMFRALVDTNKTVDMVFLDGRLVDADAEPLKKLIKPETVFVLDDFVGYEKGVMNAYNLMAVYGVYYYLIYPPAKLDCSIAMMLPRKLVDWTNQ